MTAGNGSAARVSDRTFGDLREAVAEAVLWLERAGEARAVLREGQFDERAARLLTGLYLAGRRVPQALETLRVQVRAETGVDIAKPPPSEAAG